MRRPTVSFMLRLQACIQRKPEGGRALGKCDSAHCVRFGERYGHGRP
nr:MAG TPA: hypothetical protein [Caudoviricetes sp.]